MFLPMVAADAIGETSARVVINLPRPIRYVPRPFATFGENHNDESRGAALDLRNGITAEAAALTRPRQSRLFVSYRPSIVLTGSD